MSRTRALARAERQSAAAARAAAERERLDKQAARRRRRERRSLRRRRLRIFGGAPRGRRQAELRAAATTVAFVALVCAYVFTRSVRDTLGIVLVLCIAVPIALKLSSDRSPK